MSLRALAATLFFALAAGGCVAPPTVGEHSVSGTVSGLTGEGVLLTDVAGTSVFVSSNGKFILENAFPDGAAYDVTVLSDPSIPTTRCTIANGKGTIEGADVDGVAVACGRTTFTLGGKVSGLHAVGLVLEARGEMIALAQEGTFTFRQPITDGSSFAVAIVQQPDGTVCSIANGAGVIAAKDITAVDVVCTEEPEEPAADSP